MSPPVFRRSTQQSTTCLKIGLICALHQKGFLSTDIPNRNVSERFGGHCSRYPNPSWTVSGRTQVFGRQGVNTNPGPTGSRTLPLHNIQIIPPPSPPLPSPPQKYRNEFFYSAKIQTYQKSNRWEIPGLTMCRPFIPP